MMRPWIRVASVLLFGCLPATSAAFASDREVLSANRPNVIAFPAQEAKFVRLILLGSKTQPCVDELEVFDAEQDKNVALASSGAKATASSCLPKHDIHKIVHLNDGLYGNAHSWIAAGQENQWAQIELAHPTRIHKVVFSRDRGGKFTDRMPEGVEVLLSSDAKQWRKVGESSYIERDPLKSAFLRELDAWTHLPTDDHLSPLVTDRPALPGEAPYWTRLAKREPLDRVLVLMEDLCNRMAARGVDVSVSRRELAAFRAREQALTAASSSDAIAAKELYLDARLAKRRLMLTDPELAPVSRILFVKRHPYLSSHNYSDVMDSQFRSGGGVYVLEIPSRDGRLDPAEARLTTLFDGAEGIVRDAMLDFDARKVYFAFRPSREGIAGYPKYWHLMVVNLDGTGLKQLTDGPYHDMYPCPLPDGGLAMISTRCEKRFLCWRPQAFVLYRIDDPLSDKKQIKPLSFANLTEWSASVMQDGRILWTRSEYLDKGADFGHTLWAIHPDGSHPALVFGNNTPNCYMNAREVPGTEELLCTLISHGGDHNGPLGLVDRRKGPFDPTAVTNITPDVRPQYNMQWIRGRCFRDPSPITRDYFLASHAAGETFGVYVVDRYGNRELLYLDPEIGCMNPCVVRKTSRPPVLGEDVMKTASAGQSGQFTLLDVYQGLGPSIPRGTVKYLRICEEVRAPMQRDCNGLCRLDVGADFTNYYATPIHLVRGPHGWTSYVAKASLGLVPVEEDGSASFSAPSGKVIYFEALDADLNEIQRMRSVVQLQPGERRSCIGCHEDRRSAPPTSRVMATRREPSTIEPPSWGSGPFSYEKIVQPIWDAQCVRCHGPADKKMNLAGTLDKDRVPASYRTLIAGGWVHYFNYVYSLQHDKAAPLSFGTVQSRLCRTLEVGHHEVKLTADQWHRVKCWIDLNCPLWPDYQYRLDRPGPEMQMTKTR